MTFDIRKFLTENKITTVSQRLEEADSYGMPGSSVVKEKKSGSGGSAPKAPKAPKAGGETNPFEKKEGGEEEGTEAIDQLIEQFKELSKDQKVAFAKEVAKALQPKKKKEDKEEVDEELKGGQKKLDKDGDGEIDGDDFKLMKKKGGDLEEKKEAKLNPNAGKRAEQVAQGAYDGRFKNKVVPDKKKQANKDWARNK
jgi:hypothetical protein